MIPRPLIPLDDALIAACTDGLVVVANQRLKRQLTHAWNTRQVGSGVKAWRSARVASLEEWLTRCYGRLRAIGDPRAQRHLLDASSQRLAWMQCAPPDARPHAGGLYSLARHAWELLHAYQLEAQVPGFLDNENTRLFRAWADRYRAAAGQRWLTVAELSTVMTPCAERLADSGRGPYVFLGFEPPPPTLSALTNVLCELGVDCRFHERVSGSPTAPRCVRCPTPEAELAAAVSWARDRLLRAGNEPVAIGIAVPEVTGRYDAVTRQLDAILNPHRLDDDPRGRTWDVSGGTSLRDHACVATALEFLGFVVEPRAATDVAAVLRSPFLAFGEADLRPPAWLPARFTFPALVDALGLRRTEGTAAAQTLRAVQGHLTGAPRVASLGIWSDHFRSCLDAAGWPGNATDSTTYQAAQAFLELLEEATRGGRLSAVLEPTDALALIEGLASERLFAPRRPFAPIQVVSHSEIRVLSFTHLWAAGLTDRDWPGSPRPNPFVPLRLQRAAGVPRCDQKAQYDYAREALEGWRRCTGELVLSAARREGDEALEPTGLVPRDQWHDHAPIAAHPFWVAAPVPLEALHDTRGSRADPLRRRSSATLRDQALCPFRGFALHRLGAGQEAPAHSLPDARERGILVHEALQAAYATVTDSAQLGALTPVERAALARQVARTAVARRARRFPARVQGLEVDRISRLVEGWLGAEASRPTFRVLEREAMIETSAGTLPLRLRIDRIDEVAGGRMIVDYKTGSVDLRGWHPAALTEPQLPLYAQSVDGVVAAVYGHIAPERLELIGIAADPPAVAATDAPVHDPSRLGASSWTALREAWHTALAELGNAFVAGDARVAPVNSAACAACELHPLCRIRTFNGG